MTEDVGLQGEIDLGPHQEETDVHVREVVIETIDEEEIALLTEEEEGKGW